MAESLDPDSYRSQLKSLTALTFNYDDKLYHDSGDKSGWNIDNYHALIATEDKGKPVNQGAFERVKNAIQLYQFPEPRLIRAVFDPKENLPGRNMLLLANFAGFKFEFGVRVTDVIDEMRSSEKNQALKVWGYSYRTLKGHFEIGQITFLVSKNIETGEVTFDISSYSRPDRIPNFFYRIGFRIFGRSLQKYFAASSIRRLKKIASGEQGG